MRASLAALAVAGIALVACDRGGAGDPAPVASLEEPSPELLASARRPGRRLVMERVGERCELRREEASGEVERQRELVACPRDLELGERVRLLGDTCAREGGEPGRQVPVVCPGDLLDLDADLREDSGP